MKGVHKLVKLAALGVYFDTDTGSLDKGDREGTIGALKQMLSGPGKHQYILKPVTGEARVRFCSGRSIPDMAKMS